MPPPIFHLSPPLSLCAEKGKGLRLYVAGGYAGDGAVLAGHKVSVHPVRPGPPPVPQDRRVPEHVPAQGDVRRESAPFRGEEDGLLAGGGGRAIVCSNAVQYATMQCNYAAH